MTNNNRSAYTLFELIAVLTVSGIIFLLVMGSYNSWSTIHACNGAANILKAEIRQARAMAMSKNRYIGIFMESYTSNLVKQVNYCQLYICTNDTGDVESLLDKIKSTSFKNQQDAFESLEITPAGSELKLSGHVELETYADETRDSPESGVLLFSRPDGSIWNGIEDSQYQYIEVNSRRLFNENPISRILLIDLTTGAVNITKGE